MKIEVVFEDFFLESIFNLSEIGGFVLSLFMTSQPAPSDVPPSEWNKCQTRDVVNPDVHVSRL